MLFYVLNIYCYMLHNGPLAKWDPGPGPGGNRTRGRPGPGPGPGGDPGQWDPGRGNPGKWDMGQGGRRIFVGFPRFRLKCTTKLVPSTWTKYLVFTCYIHIYLYKLH